MGRFGRASALGALVAVALLLGVTMTAGTVQARWYAEWDSYQTAAYPGAVTVLTFNLTNIGSEDVTISGATYSVDWGFYTATAYLNGDMVLSPGEQSSLTCAITVPSVEKGRYRGTVEIVARASSDWWSTSEQYNVPMRVSSAPPLDVAIQASKISGQSPLDVDFATTVIGGIGPYIYRWEAGDGTTDDGPSISHRYTKVGTYRVNVTVTDSLGSVAKESMNVTVDPGDLMVSINPRTLSGVAPMEINLNSSVSGGTGPYTYQWTTGDGGTGIASSFWYEYKRAGTYPVKLVVTDSKGNTASDKITVTVQPATDMGANTGKGTSISPAVQGLAAVFVAVSFVGAAVILRRNRQ